jgi:hypothetical protein
MGLTGESTLCETNHSLGETLAYNNSSGNAVGGPEITFW